MVEVMCREKRKEKKKKNQCLAIRMVGLERLSRLAKAIRKNATVNEQGKSEREGIASLRLQENYTHFNVFSILPLPLSLLLLDNLF